MRNSEVKIEAIKFKLSFEYCGMKKKERLSNFLSREITHVLDLSRRVQRHISIHCGLEKQFAFTY